MASRSKGADLRKVIRLEAIDDMLPCASNGRTTLATRNILTLRVNKIIIPRLFDGRLVDRSD